jgi:hypothetical protein
MGLNGVKWRSKELKITILTDVYNAILFFSGKFTAEKNLTNAHTAAVSLFKGKQYF